MDSQYPLHWLRGITIQQAERRKPALLNLTPRCVVPDDWINVSPPEDEQQQ